MPCVTLTKVRTENIIETRRVRVRRAQAEDAENYWRLQNDPAVLPRGPKLPLEKAKEAVTNIRDDDFSRLILKLNDGRFVGRCGLIRWLESDWEILMYFLPEHQRKRFGPELF